MKRLALTLLAVAFCCGMATAQDPAPAAPTPCVKKCCAKKAACPVKKCCPEKAACPAKKCCPEKKACCPKKSCCPKKN
ncbi:MAG: hypothetical protein IKA23_05695 [Akkermansia sp.]|nr:hypothetical protein [Akkermansia sp.]MBR2313550.1 hypothetical protein [Akkermansia sp.]